MWANHSKFKDWNDPAWESWRERERNGGGVDEGLAILLRRFCADCGFAHQLGNHAPARVEGEKATK